MTFNELKRIEGDGVSITNRGSDCTIYAGHEQAFAAWVVACTDFPEWAFRIRSGPEVDTFRIEAFSNVGQWGHWVR